MTALKLTSTSWYTLISLPLREPTHTSFYLKYNSSSDNATKDSVIKTLSRRATSALLNTSKHSSLSVYNICLSNRFLPDQRTTTIMNQVKKNIKRPTTNLSHRQFKKLLNKDSLPSLPT